MGKNNIKDEDNNYIRIVKTPIWLLVIVFILIVIGLIVWFTNGYIKGALI